MRIGMGNMKGYYTPIKNGIRSTIDINKKIKREVRLIDD